MLRRTAMGGQRKQTQNFTIFKSSSCIEQSHEGSIWFHSVGWNMAGAAFKVIDAFLLMTPLIFKPDQKSL